ncbi:MAG TPA: C39 family peptidase [Candidatus Dormibacteraeota bacterium]|nr:C39 family peptidase [Candidatus Dormibacteraeota bacterium]
MIRLLKWVAALGVVAMIAIGAGVYFAFFGAGPRVSYVTPDIVPITVSTAAPSDQPPVNLPVAVILPVPFTPQAPLGNWAARQHTCEEASLVMVDRYLRGDHSGALIDPHTADAAINQITAWKPTVDLTVQQLGEVANTNLGWAYQVVPADRLSMKQQLALGRPLIVGVRTHGLGNTNYPGFSTHFEQPGWSVSHYLVVTGYDQGDAYVLNDPGLTRGHGYHIPFDQLMHAIDDLDQAYPNLNAGRVFLVLAPAA